jgi:hypothetical protein
MKFAPPVAFGDLKKMPSKGKASPAESGRGNASQSVLRANKVHSYDAIGWGDGGDGGLDIKGERKK